MPGCSVPKFSRSLVLTAGLLVLSASSAHEAAASDKRLFVLQEASGAIVEYDLKTGVVVKSVPVPPEVFKQEHPVIVSHRGQVLISLYQPDGYAVPMRHWIWDGNNAQMLVPSVSPADDSDGWAFPRPLLSADGGNPFWYKTDMKGTGQAVQPIFQMFRGILRGPGGEQIVLKAFDKCECTTGACSESCPVGQVWAPHGVVDDFFFVTYFDPGQLQASYDSTYLFARRGSRWTSQKREEASELILDAKSRGEVIVEVSPDAGCCGWENESSDRTLVRRSGNSMTIFDEWTRYKNQRYDVNFFSANAEISPDGIRLAHTIASSADPNSGIRPSSTVPEGVKIPAEEISKLRELIARHPLVEVVALNNPSRPPTVIQQATLIGWLSDREIMIFKDKKLLIADAYDGKLIRTLPLDVERPRSVFLR
jgi:hypothetical protein